MKLYSGIITLTFDCSDDSQRDELEQLGNHNEKSSFIYNFQQYLRRIYKYESNSAEFTDKEFELINRIYTDWYRFKEEEGVIDE